MGGCHKIYIVTSHRGDRDQWRATIEAMVTKGADATDDEFNRIIDYLAKHYGPDNSEGKLNVNAATTPEIAGFFGLPEAQAASIREAPRRSGKFKSLQELTGVPGVDTVKIEAKKDRIAY